MNKDDFKTISIVIPVFNEESNVAILHEKIIQAISPLDYKFEIIFIDDGSKDATFEKLEDIRQKDNRVKVIRHRRNFGKAVAYSSGFQYARGDIVITMDGDLQDNPEEIPKFIDKICQGYDVVNGWKYQGKGPFLKRVPSKIFNRVTSLLTGVRLHDFNCPFKAYIHEAVKSLQIYGDLYRFIPVIAIKRGFTVTEIKISNLPRIHGKSKYGGSRFLNGFLDLLTILFLTKFAKSPLHLYGTVGLFLSFMGGLLVLYLIFMRLGGVVVGLRLLTLGIFLLITGIQFVSIGLICEMIASASAKDRTRDRLNIKSTLE